VPAQGSHLYALVYLLQIFLDLIEEVDAIIDKSVGVGAPVTVSFPDGILN